MKLVRGGQRTVDDVQYVGSKKWASIAVPNGMRKKRNNFKRNVIALSVIKVVVMRSEIAVLLILTFSCMETCAEQRKFSMELFICEKKAKDIESKMSCVDSELSFQKNRLDEAYKKVARKISPESRALLDKVQHDWLLWRDENYDFLSEHVAVAFVTARVTSMNFLLNSVYDRANELETISDELGD